MFNNSVSNVNKPSETEKPNYFLARLTEAQLEAERQKSWMKGFAKGMKKSMLEAGLATELEIKLETAKAMLEYQLPLDLIALYTGLTPSEIQMLQPTP